jgi:hypothetical protein
MSDSLAAELTLAQVNAAAAQVVAQAAYNSAAQAVTESSNATAAAKAAQTDEDNNDDNAAFNDATSAQIQADNTLSDTNATLTAVNPPNSPGSNCPINYDQNQTPLPNPC